MSEFQFFKFKAKEENTDGGISREEMQEVALRFGIPNTDRITKDSNGNYYHDHEPLNDDYLRDHKPDQRTEGPPKKHY